MKTMTRVEEQAVRSGRLGTLDGDELHRLISYETEIAGRLSRDASEQRLILAIRQRHPGASPAAVAGMYHRLKAATTFLVEHGERIEEQGIRLEGPGITPEALRFLDLLGELPYSESDDGMPRFDAEEVFERLAEGADDADGS